MEMIPIVSSNIKSIGYSANILRIEYTYGAIYDFLNVPQNIFDEFLKSESKGKFFHSQINKKYQSVKLEV